MPENFPKMMPYITFDSDDLPEISGFKIGGKYTLCIEVEMTNVGKGDEFDMFAEGEEKESALNARFKVMSVELKKKKPVDETGYTRKSFAKEKGRRLAAANRRRMLGM
jgi:hypothetical protein